MFLPRYYQEEEEENRCFITHRGGGSVDRQRKETATLTSNTSERSGTVRCEQPIRTEPVRHPLGVWVNREETQQNRPVSPADGMKKEEKIVLPPGAPQHAPLREGEIREDCPRVRHAEPQEDRASLPQPEPEPQLPTSTCHAVNTERVHELLISSFLSAAPPLPSSLMVSSSSDSGSGSV